MDEDEAPAHGDGEEHEREERRGSTEGSRGKGEVKIHDVAS
jgi:hypothetical protein